MEGGYLQKTVPQNILVHWRAESWTPLGPRADRLLAFSTLQGLDGRKHAAVFELRIPTAPYSLTRNVNPQYFERKLALSWGDTKHSTAA